MTCIFSLRHSLDSR